MTKEEKRKAIIQRIPVLDDTFTDQHISFILILAYLEELAKMGIVGGGKIHLSNMGANAVAVCEEFDWKPTNEDIELFLSAQSEPECIEMLRFFITEYRDNRDKVVESVKTFKEKYNL